MGRQKVAERRLGLHVEQRGTLREHVAVLRSRLDQAAADLRVSLGGLVAMHRVAGLQVLW